MSEETTVEATEEVAVEEPKKEMSYPELMEKLKDPELVKMAAAKIGMEVVKPTAQQVAAVDVPQTSFEKFEITDDMEANESKMARQFNEKMAAMADSTNKQVSAAQQANEQSQTVRDEGRQRKEINKFADSIGGEDKLAEVMDFLKPIYMSPDSPTCGNIEASYAAARRAKGLPIEGEQTETKSKETETAPKKKKISSVKSSEQAEVPAEQELSDKPKTYEGAAMGAWDKMIANGGSDPFKTEE
jgi:hypothetical protein